VEAGTNSKEKKEKKGDAVPSFTSSTQEKRRRVPVGRLQTSGPDTWHGGQGKEGGGGEGEGIILPSNSVRGGLEEAFKIRHLGDRSVRDEKKARARKEGEGGGGEKNPSSSS